MKLRWLVLLGLLVTAVLVPAGLVTAVPAPRPSPAAPGVRLVAFTPYALLLYLPALPFLLLAWCAGPTAPWRGTARCCSSSLSLAGVALHALLASGPFLRHTAAEAGGTDRCR